MRLAPAVGETHEFRDHLRIVGRVVDDDIKELLATLLAYPDVEPGWTPPKATSVHSAAEPH